MSYQRGHDKRVTQADLADAIRAGVERDGEAALDARRGQPWHGARDTSPWYPVDAPPPERVKVRLLWDGRRFEAWRDRVPRTRHAVWAFARSGTAVYLTPDLLRRAQLRDHGPSAWQPLDPQTWPHTLPEPFAGPYGAAWSLSPPATAPVDEADVKGLVWWRDSTRITYSPAGRISRSEAEGRILRAFCFERRIRVESPDVKTNAEVVARLAQIAAGPSYAVNDYVARLQPNGRDADDYLTAVGWIKSWRLGDERREVLWLRSLDRPRTFREIGKIFSSDPKQPFSPEWARGFYGRTLDDVVEQANDQA